MPENQNDEITVAEATIVLGVSKTKMAELLRLGILTWRKDPLDNRIKRVKLSQVQKLLADDKRHRIV